MDPIDYSGAFTNVQPPTQAFMQGLQSGAALQQVQAEQAQQQVAAAQKQQMQTDLAALSANPTPQAIAQASLKYPQLSEQFKRSLDMLTPAQQQAKINAAGPVHAAALAGEYGVAAKQLREHADALQNSGQEQEAKQTRAMADMIEQHPETATTTTGLLLAAAMGPDKYATTFKDVGSERRADQLQPDAVRKGAADADAAASEASTKAVTAKYADSQALADLAKKQWDVKKIVADIDFQKESNRIAAMNAAAAREGNSLKREELKLKIQDAVRERDDKVRTKVADAESAAGSIDNMLNNIDRILNVAEEKQGGKGTGKGTSLLRAASGPLDSRLPTMQGDVADLEALVETLGSQAFLSQIPNIKGMGSLSNAEGEKLQSAFQNFNLRQSDTQLITNLKEAKRLLTTGRGTISKRFGVPLGNPNTPASESSAGKDMPPLSSFNRRAQ